MLAGLCVTPDPVEVEGVIFSRKCGYALRALTHLAESRRVCRVREISRAQQVPYPYMAKVLQTLKRKGFVRSTRGVTGGYELGRPAQKVRLIDVLEALDGDQVFRQCIYGLSGCSETTPCPLHEGWKFMRADIEAYLSNHTIADMVETGVNEKGTARPKKTT